MDKAAQNLKNRQAGKDQVFNYWADTCVCEPLRESSTKNPITGQDFVANDPNQKELSDFCEDLKGLDKTNPTKAAWTNPCEQFIAKNLNVESKELEDDINWQAMAYDCLCQRIKKGKNPYNRDATVPKSLADWAEKNAERLLISYLAVVWSDVLERYAAKEDDPSIKFEASRVTKTLSKAGYDTPDKRKTVVDASLAILATIKHDEEKVEEKVRDALIALGKHKLYLYHRSPYKKTLDPAAGSEAVKLNDQRFKDQSAAIREIRTIFEAHPAYSEYNKDAPNYNAHRKKREDIVKRVYESMDDDDEDFKTTMEKIKQEDQKAKQTPKETPKPAPKQTPKETPKQSPPAPAPKLSEKDDLKQSLSKLGRETLELYDAETYSYLKTSKNYKPNTEYARKADLYATDPEFKKKTDGLAAEQKEARAKVLDVFKQGGKYPNYYNDAEAGNIELKKANIAKREAIVREVMKELKSQKGGQRSRYW